jgi:hypothetical protein
MNRTYRQEVNTAILSSEVRERNLPLDSEVHSLGADGLPTKRG